MAKGDARMPFGKYKGQPLSDCPTDYLDWLLGQDWLRRELAEAIESHLKTRADWARKEAD